MVEKISPKSNIGVSPVIGVILMVAITVVLSAVVGGIAIQIGEDTKQNPKASFDFGGSFREAGPNQGDPQTRIRLVTVKQADFIWVKVDGNTSNWGYDPNQGLSSSDISSDDPGPTGTPQAYLLAPDAGGAGTTVRIGYKNPVDVSIIGHLNGKKAILQSFETDMP